MNTEEFVKSIMKNNSAYYDFNVSNETDVEINVDFGDWKHDHLFVDRIMKENGFEKTDEEVTWDDGSDVFSAIHYFKKIETPTIVAGIDIGSPEGDRYVKTVWYGDNIVRL